MQQTAGAGRYPPCIAGMDRRSSRSICRRARGRGIPAAGRAAGARRPIEAGRHGAGRPASACASRSTIGMPVIVDRNGMPVGMQLGRSSAATRRRRIGLAARRESRRCVSSDSRAPANSRSSVARSATSSFIRARPAGGGPGRGAACRASCRRESVRPRRDCSRTWR